MEMIWKIARCHSRSFRSLLEAAPQWPPPQYLAAYGTMRWSAKEDCTTCTTLTICSTALMLPSQLKVAALIAFARKDPFLRRSIRRAKCTKHKLAGQLHRTGINRLNGRLGRLPAGDPRRGRGGTRAEDVVIGPHHHRCRARARPPTWTKGDSLAV